MLNARLRPTESLRDSEGNWNNTAINKHRSFDTYHPPGHAAEQQILIVNSAAQKASR